MNMKQLQYVQVLASVGSFSKASDLLNISQPTLSQSIKKAERELGMELFDRAGGSVRLTDAGRVYIQIGRRMRELEHQLDSRLMDIAEYQTGTITVGLSAHRSVALMPRIVKEFKELYPGIVLHIEERKRSEILDAAEHGEFDLCLTTLPVAPQFCYETAYIEENVLAVPEYVELNGKPMPDRKFPAVSVSQIDHSRFAMLNDEHPMQYELKQLCDQYCLNLTTTVVCTSLEVLFEMVKMDMGFAYIPSCMAHPTKGIRFYSLAENTNQREIIIMHRKTQYLSKPVLQLKEMFIQER